MSSVIKEKGRGFYGRMYCVVVGKLEEVKILLPIVFSGVNKCSKSFKNGSISPLNLSIALRVIWSSVNYFCSESCKDVLPKGGRELRALVREKSVRKTVMTKYMFNKRTRGLLGGKLLRACCKPEHLAKLAYKCKCSPVEMLVSW